VIVRGQIRLAAAIIVLSISSVSGWAAELPLPATEAPVFLVIFDLRSNEPGEITSTTEGGGPLNFPISAIDDEKVQCSVLKSRAPLTQLKGYVECAIGHRLSGLDFNDTDDDATNDFPTVAERENAATAIAANIVEFRKDSSTRAISDRGSFIVAVGLQTAEARTISQIVTANCLDPISEPPRVTTTSYELVFGRKPQFTIGEVARKSQIETDFNVLLTLASKFIAGTPPAPAPPPPDPCRRRDTETVEYRSTPPKATAWTSGHAIPLAVKRANVTLDATLPAVVPQLLAATDQNQAKEVMKRADEFFRLAALKKQEDEDLSLFKTCPAVEPGRFDPLQQVVCGLDDKSTATTPTSLAAVDALTKMTTPRRVTFLRWAVEHKTGEVRDKAMVALAQVPATAPSAAAPAKEAKQTTKFLSGPLEHWSISADVFTTRKTVFKKDDTGTFGLDGKPPVFYVSLNFLMGDLPSTDRSFLQNIELKWLVQGSKKPLDSMGFGIGFRGSYGKRFGFNFDLLSPYVGFTWTEQADSSLPRVRQTRFGVGLNINKALDWVK